MKYFVDIVVVIFFYYKMKGISTIQLVFHFDIIELKGLLNYISNWGEKEQKTSRGFKQLILPKLLRDYILFGRVAG